MSTTADYTDYVMEQFAGAGALRSRKMFGEYMVYIDEKPALLLCDNRTFVKILPCTTARLGANHPKAFPYDGAKEHYVLDVDDKALCVEIGVILARELPIPKPKKKKSKPA